MNRAAEFHEGLQAALAADPEANSDHRLVTFLESRGFAYGARSATNLRLLAYTLPPECVRAVALAALASAMPDMALNNLERISSVIPQEELRAVCARKGRLTELLTVCGASPFLVNIICRDPAYFHNLIIAKGIEQRRSEAEALAVLRTQLSPGIDYPSILPLLRRFKYAEILRIATRDLTGLAPLEEVTAELSALAAATLQVAHEVSRRDLVAEHGIPLMETPQGLREADMVVMGMGKFGGRELNFSSDIDIIYFYSSDQGETAGIPDGMGGVQGKISLHAFFVKQAEMITKAIAQVTEDGFVFRVDLGLRPEGKNGDMAISLRAAETYYEYWGQSWERAAMLKARPVAGSKEVGDQFLRLIQPFIYRKYLDYNLVEDMMGMKMKIDASLAREREGEYNIKLGRGGIREI